MRERFADTTAALESFREHANTLEQNTAATRESVDELRTFNEEMEGSFELMKRKPHWSKCIDKFLSAALGQAVEDASPRARGPRRAIAGEVLVDVNPAARGA